MTDAVLQIQHLGAICFNVSDPGAATSNSFPLVVGGGNNAGTIRREPLVVPPGHFYSIVIEGGVPFAPVSLFADFGIVIPQAAFPDPVTNFVLALTPLTGSAGPFVVAFDGVGVFGPPQGITFDANGTFVLPGIQLPFPLFGVPVTLQAVYLDPTSPLGFRLTWAKFPELI
jgi:hypothetical protein